MKKTAAAFAALALAAAPAAAAPVPEPAGERVEGSTMRGGVYWLLPALIVVALLIAILAGGDEQPRSP